MILRNMAFNEEAKVLQNQRVNLVYVYFVVINFGKGPAKANMAVPRIENPCMHA